MYRIKIYYSFQRIPATEREMYHEKNRKLKEWIYVEPLMSDHLKIGLWSEFTKLFTDYKENGRSEIGRK